MPSRLATLWILALVGCQAAPPAAHRACISNQIVQRFDKTIPECGTGFALPPGTSLDDGLNEDEAVAIALWNNAAFLELLADLGIARGDLLQAGLLPNPEFVYIFGVTDKPFKYLLDFPLEALWLRPIRVKAAAGEVDRTAQRLTQAGLDLIRDVRQGYADTLLARERIRVAAEGVKLRGRIAELAEIRLKAGDISPQEAATAKIDALQAEQDAARVAGETAIAEERLRNLLGFGTERPAFVLAPSPRPERTEYDVDALAEEAIRTRPDALAAADAVAAAEERLRLAKLGWVRLLGILDATSGRNGNNFGPALRVTVPIFNFNEGGVARAEAELERAQRNRQTVANQIVLDVRRSYLQYRQTCGELDVLLTKVRPEVETAIRRAQAAYQEGNVAIFIVLETTRQLLDSYLREAVLDADLRRFFAELERSVGRRLAAGVPAP